MCRPNVAYVCSPVKKTYDSFTTRNNINKFLMFNFEAHLLATHVKISQLVASLQTSCQQVVFALLVTSCQQVWNKLLTTCNNLVDIVRLVTRLFQQGCYNHDITILLQPWAVNLVTSCYIMTVSDLLEQPCNKFDNAIKLVTSCQQLVPNLLQQTRNKQCENNLLTTCEQTCYNLFADLLQLVRFYACILLL